jgi:hypothetical protein
LESTTLIFVKLRREFLETVSGATTSSLLLKLRCPNAAEKDLRLFTDATKDRPAAAAASDATSESDPLVVPESRRFPTTASPAVRHRSSGDAAPEDIPNHKQTHDATASVRNEPGDVRGAVGV